MTYLLIATYPSPRTSVTASVGGASLTARSVTGTGVIAVRTLASMGSTSAASGPSTSAKIRVLSVRPSRAL